MVSLALFALGGFWAAVIALDHFLHGKYKHVYSDWLESAGLSVSPGRISWYTTRLNRLFVAVGTYAAPLLRIWFNCGVVFGVIAMIASVLILIANLYKTVFIPAEPRILTPVVPGVNIPTNQLFYYAVALAISGFIHEVGHAIAATCDRVPVNGFGLFMFVLYPGAFVDLAMDSMTVLSPHKQLRIYFAGAWHNFVVAVSAYGLLFILPILLLPAYACAPGGGVTVTAVAEDSPLNGALIPGTRVIGLDECVVGTREEWVTCVQSLVSHGVQQKGYCSPRAMADDAKAEVFRNVEDFLECCNITSIRGESTFCFAHWEEKDTLRANPSFACLAARRTMEERRCFTNADCAGASGVEDSVCLQPVLPDTTTRLMSLNIDGMKPLLFVGDPLVFAVSVSVSDCQPRHALLPLRLPEQIDTQLRYLFSLSGALALLNLVPCYKLDGQWALVSLVDALLRGRMSEKQREGISETIVLAGTILFGANVAVAILM